MATYKNTDNRSENSFIAVAAPILATYKDLTEDLERSIQASSLLQSPSLFSTPVSTYNETKNLELLKNQLITKVAELKKDAIKFQSQCTKDARILSQLLKIDDPNLAAMLPRLVITCTDPKPQDIRQKRAVQQYLTSNTPDKHTAHIIQQAQENMTSVAQQYVNEVYPRYTSRISQIIQETDQLDYIDTKYHQIVANIRDSIQDRPIVADTKPRSEACLP